MPNSRLAQIIDTAEASLTRGEPIEIKMLSHHLIIGVVVAIRRGRNSWIEVQRSHSGALDTIAVAEIRTAQPLTARTPRVRP